MKTITAEWEGIRPLIMANPQTVDPLNKHTRKGKELNKLKKEYDRKDNYEELVRVVNELYENDWMASAYWDDTLGFYLPETMILACIRSGAQRNRKGKDVASALLLEQDRVKVICKREHKNLKAAYHDPEYVLKLPVRVPPKTGPFVMKCRCIIPTGWRLKFDIHYDEEIIGEADIKTAMHNAGSLSGLGGWKPRFGRFLVR